MDYAQLFAGVRDSFTELTGWLRAQQPRLVGAAAGRRIEPPASTVRNE